VFPEPDERTGGVCPADDIGESKAKLEEMWYVLVLGGRMRSEMPGGAEAISLGAVVNQLPSTSRNSVPVKESKSQNGAG